jgi:hypothetical protein
MDHISGFFSRYLSPYLKHQHAKEFIAQVCSEVLGVPVSPEQITIKGSVCSISGNRGLKHQIFLKQEEIQKRLAENPVTRRVQVIV